MKLNNKQKAVIEDYLDTFGIKYYELKQEFLDHMICSVESIITEKQIGLNEAIRIAKNDFEPLGFRGIIGERQNELKKYYRKVYFNSIKGFFKFPQILLSLFLFISFYCILNLYSNALKGAIILNLMGVFLIIIESVKLFKLRKKENQIVLRTDKFLSYNISIVMMLPQSLLNFINGFKESLDMENIIVKIILAIVLVYSFLSVIVFKKLAKKEIQEVRKLYYAE